jgi:hypothetical protein
MAPRDFLISLGAVTVRTESRESEEIMLSVEKKNLKLFYYKYFSIKASNVA